MNLLISSSEHFFNEPCLVWPGRRMATSLAWPPSTAPPRAYWPATQAGNTSQHRISIKKHHDSDISMAILKKTQNTKLKLTNKRVVFLLFFYAEHHYSRPLCSLCSFIEFFYHFLTGKLTTAYCIIHVSHLQVCSLTLFTTCVPDF